MGFGDIRNEFYLGSERISQLTNLKPNELQICMTDVGDVMPTAGYSHFYLGKVLPTCYLISWVPIGFMGSYRFICRCTPTTVSTSIRTGATRGTI